MNLMPIASARAFPRVLFPLPLPPQIMIRLFIRNQPFLSLILSVLEVIYGVQQIFKMCNPVKVNFPTNGPDHFYRCIPAPDM